MASGQLYLFQIRLFITASGQVPPGLDAAIRLRFKEIKKGRRTPSSLKPFGNVLIQGKVIGIQRGPDQFE